MAIGSLPYFQNWSDLVGYHNGFHQVGFVLLVSPDNRERLEQNVAMQRSLGINTSVVAGDDLRELLPGVDLDDGAVGAWEPESGYADPMATTHSFMRSAVNHGASVVEGVAVTAIRHQGGKVVGVDTTDGAYDAPIVVCAANIWSPALLRTAGVELDLAPLRSQMAFFRAPEPLRPRARLHPLYRPGPAFGAGGSRCHQCVWRNMGTGAQSCPNAKPRLYRLGESCSRC